MGSLLIPNNCTEPRVHNKYLKNAVILKGFSSVRSLVSICRYFIRGAFITQTTSQGAEGQSHKNDFQCFPNLTGIGTIRTECPNADSNSTRLERSLRFTFLTSTEAMLLCRDHQPLAAKVSATEIPLYLCSPCLAQETKLYTSSLLYVNFFDNIFYQFNDKRSLL